MSPTDLIHAYYDAFNRGDRDTMLALLADEPTGNLDTKTAADVFELLRCFNEQFGCAVLVVTHDPRLAETCDRTVTLVDGRIDGGERHDARRPG